MRVLILTMLCTGLWSGAALAGEPPSTVTARGAVGVAVSDSTKTFPEASIEGDFPLGPHLRGRATLELSGLPGQAVGTGGLSISDPSTFRAAGGRVAVGFPIHKAYESLGQLVYQAQRISIELEASGYTRLATRDERPRDRLASELMLKVRVERRNLDGDVERFVSVGFGHSDIPGPPNRGFDPWHASVEGRAKVRDVKGVGVSIGGRVDADLLRRQGGRDRFTVSVGVGR